MCLPMTEDSSNSSNKVNKQQVNKKVLVGHTSYHFLANYLFGFLLSNVMKYSILIG